MNTFTCVYCKSTLPRSQVSKAHIFAASLGGSVSLPEAVCKGCNGQIRTQLEDPFKDRWAWLVLLMEIKGRRKKGPKLDASIHLFERDINITIRTFKSAPNIPPIIEKDKNGKQIIHFIGPHEYVERKKTEYEKKRPRTAWREQDTAEVRSSEIKFPVDVDSLNNPFSRRLAAKIAFEFWGLNRGPKELLESQYNALREFISQGTEPRTGSLAGLLCDEVLISRNLNIAIPNHAVCLNLHPSNSILGAIVVFFGMFYYWVILNPRYPLTASLDDLTVVSPRAKSSINAILTGSAKLPRLPWERILRSDPDVVRKAWTLARQKFEALLSTR